MALEGLHNDLGTTTVCRSGLDAISEVNKVALEFGHGSALVAEP
jgi:hypothetical protein